MAIKLKTKTPLKETAQTNIGKKETQVSKKPSFLKTGKDAAEAFKKEEVKAQKRQEEAGKLWRYYIKFDKSTEGKEFRITFLDGEINELGMLDNPAFYEHTVFHNGSWANVIALDEDDPITAQNGEPNYVQAFTVIDHRPFTKKDGSEVKISKKLFVAKRTTIKLLTNIAKKRGGLTGCTFDVMRSSGNAPNVGDNFDFVEKHSLQELESMYGKELAEPADYADELVQHTREELLDMGYGDASDTINAGSVDEDELEDTL